MSNLPAKYEDLNAWQKARQLTKEIHRMTESKNFEKSLGLVEKMRDSSISIMFNLSSGYLLRAPREFHSYLVEAQSSTAALETYLYVALDQEYVIKADFNRLYELTQAVQAGIEELLKMEHDN